MVANTNETMTKMFDSMNDTFKATMSAFGRMQECYTKPFAGVNQEPTDSKVTPFAQAGFKNVAKGWVPFVEKNFETFNETCHAAFDAGLKAMKTAATAAPEGNNVDFAKGTQRAFAATMEAFDANMSTLGKACVRTTENCTKLMHSVVSDATRACSSTGCESKRENARSTDAKGSGKTTNK